MFLRTERLFLRPGWAEDTPELTRAIADQATVRNLSRVPWPYREEHAREWLAREQDTRLPCLLVTLPEAGGRIVGVCGLHAEDGRPTLGYWIARAFHGRGYATEAGRGIVALSRLAGHRRLNADHFVDNPASGRVLRKLGFAATGRTFTRASLGRGGASSPTVEYSLDLAEADGPQGTPMKAAA
jgi:RimJ/RimL family protein N-acetyltransferase